MSGDKHSDKEKGPERAKPAKTSSADQTQQNLKGFTSAAEKPSNADQGQQTKGGPDPKSVTETLQGWHKFVSSVKYYDGLLLLIALFLTVLISYHIDRKNHIDNNARAVHAMLDSALETTLDFVVVGPLRADDEERIRKLSLLRYRVAAGPYRIGPAESCIYTIMFQVDDFSVDPIRESYLPNGDAIAASQRIFDRVRLLRKRIDEYSGYDKFYLWWLPAARNLFGTNCFTQL